MAALTVPNVGGTVSLGQLFEAECVLSGQRRRALSAQSQISVTISVDGDMQMTPHPESAACALVSQASPPPAPRCEDVHSNDAGGFTCSERISQALENEPCLSRTGAEDKVALQHRGPCGACAASSLASHASSSHGQVRCSGSIRDFYRDYATMRVTVLPGCDTSVRTISTWFDFQGSASAMLIQHEEINATTGLRQAAQLDATGRSVSSTQCVIDPGPPKDLREFRGRVQRYEPQPSHLFDDKSCVAFVSQTSCFENIDINFNWVMQNNLGGKGPNPTDPEVLRMSSVATLDDGDSIDVEVVALSEYTPHNSRANTIIPAQKPYLQLNLRTGTEVVVEFRIVHHGTSVLKMIDSFRLDIMDFDQSVDGNGIETAEVLTTERLHDYYVSENSEVNVRNDGTLMFTSSRLGYGHDNPSNPDAMGPTQRARTVGLQFRNVSTFRMRLAVTNWNKRWREGRNFLLYGMATQVSPACLPIEQCITLKYTSPAGNLCHERTCRDMDDVGHYTMQAGMAHRKGIEVQSAVMSFAPKGDLVESREWDTIEMMLPLMVSDESRRWHEPSETLAHTLDTIWIAPRTLAKSAPTGTVKSAFPTYADLIETAGAMTVSIYRGLNSGNFGECELQSVQTGANGTFAFQDQSLMPGMYSLRVAARARNVTLAFDTFNVIWNELGVELTVIVVEVDGARVPEVEGTSQLVFNWDSMMGLRLSVHMAFGESPRLCEVFKARPECNGAMWNATTASSEMITLTKWAADTTYAVYATATKRSCSGYDLPSYPSGRVNCDGNPRTGQGYCVSSPDGTSCLKCSLWPSDPVDDKTVICTDRGVPQGGPLKGEGAWDKLAGNDAKWNSFEVDRRIQVYRTCTAKFGRSLAKLWMVHGGVLVHDSQLLAMDDTVLQLHDVQRIGCISGYPSYFPTTNALMTTSEFVADRRNTSHSCHMGAWNATALSWRCALGQWAC